MRRTVLLLAGVLLCVVALGSDSPKEYDDATMQVDELQGTWRLVGCEFDGRKAAAPYPEVLTFCNGTYTHKYYEHDTHSGSYRIDPTHKPQHLDRIASSGSLKGRTCRDIFQIDGDTLRIANMSDQLLNDKRRPQGFNDDNVFVLVYKRVRK